MSIEGSPPRRPPQISPDGKWVWDGTEWQPVAGRDTGHTAVFAAWNSVTFDPAVTTAAQAPPGQVQAPAPVINYQVDYSTPKSVIPLWQQQTDRLNKNVVYVAIAVVALVMTMIVVNAYGPFSWPWSSDAPVAAAPTPSPSPLTARSDYAVASRFLSGFLAPVMGGLNQAMSAQRLSCNGILTIGCENAITATDKQVKAVLLVANSAPAPVCITTNVTRVKADLTAIDTALQSALQAYKDNSKGELAQSLSRYNAASRPLQSDIGAIGRAQTTLCDTQVTGP